MKLIKRGDNLTIIGRRWFERVNGNTYHSVEIYLNGEMIASNPFNYGYDRQFEQTAIELLEKKYRLPLKEHEALWRLKDYGVNLVSSVTDVQRKKDL